jgi:uncharacterized protein (DUF2062 family)
VNYHRRLKYYLIKLCRLQDSPKSVAGGFVLGTVVHFYPTSGFGALFAVGLSRLFRTNCIAATIAWAITIPLFPLLFYLNILIGCIFVEPAEKSISKLFYNFSHLGWTDFLLLGKAFFIGSIINSIVATIILWWLGYIILKRYRKNILSFICRKV